MNPSVRSSSSETFILQFCRDLLLSAPCGTLSESPHTIDVHYINAANCSAAVIQSDQKSTSEHALLRRRLCNSLRRSERKFTRNRPRSVSHREGTSWVLGSICSYCLTNHKPALNMLLHSVTSLSGLGVFGCSIPLDLPRVKSRL